jgi:hypothetical protein
LVGLQVIAGEIKIYYLYVEKIQKAHGPISCAYTAEFIYSATNSTGEVPYY